MGKMDERARAELHKINQEKFFLSVLITCLFLIFKISAGMSVLEMLGELTAAGVILIYFVPYVILRKKYEVLDEMARSRLYKLSTAFCAAEFLAMIPVIIINLVLKFTQNSESVSLFDSTFLFIIVMCAVVGFYGLSKTNNEKFVSKRAALIPFDIYKKKLLIRAVAASVIIIALITALVLINNFLSAKAAYPDSKEFSRLVSMFTTLIIYCVFTLPLCWFLYVYYLGKRTKLEEKTGAENLN